MPGNLDQHLLRTCNFSLQLSSICIIFNQRGIHRGHYGIEEDVKKKSVYDLKKTYNRAVIMGIFMIGSIFAFACVVELVRRNVISFGKNAVIWGDQADFVFYVLLVISVALFFIIRFLKQYYLQENIMFMPDDQQSSEASQPSTGILNLLIVAVMTYAFCEAPAIFGFVLFFLMGANPFYFYTLMLMSLVFFVVYFPRYRQWEDWMQEHIETPGCSSKTITDIHKG